MVVKYDIFMIEQKTFLETKGAGFQGTLMDKWDWRQSIVKVAFVKTNMYA